MAAAGDQGAAPGPPVGGLSIRAPSTPALRTTARVRKRGPVLDAFQRRASQPRLLPGHFRPPPDQHDHGDDRRGARRAHRPDRADADLNVVVFASANPDFYLAHYDVENDPARTAALGVGPTMPAWIDVLLSGPRAGSQHRLDSGTRPRRRKRVRSRLRPAVRLAREHPARPVRGRHRCGPRRRPDGPARPAGGPRPGARDPARRRRSRRTARGAVRVRQPLDRRRPARRGGRRDRLEARALRPRRDRAHEVLRRPGHVAGRQRACRPLWTISASCSGVPRSRRSGPGSRSSGSTPTATSSDASGAGCRVAYPTPQVRPARARTRSRARLRRAPGVNESRAWRTPWGDAFDRPRTEEQAGTDLGVRQPFASEPRDLRLLRGQLIAGLDRPRTDLLAGRRQLAAGALREGLHLDRRRACRGRHAAARALRHDGSPGAATRRTGGGQRELGRSRVRPSRSIASCITVPRSPVAQQCPAARLDAEREVVGGGLRRLGEPLERIACRLRCLFRAPAPR